MVAGSRRRRKERRGREERTTFEQRAGWGRRIVPGTAKKYCKIVSGKTIRIESGRLDPLPRLVKGRRAVNEKAKQRWAEAARAVVIFGALAVILAAIPLYAESVERELYAEAGSFFYGRNYPLALESYSRFVDRFPFSTLVPDALYRRAVCLYRLGRYDEALTLFASIERSRAAGSSPVPCWRGMILFEKKDYPWAIASFQDFMAGDVEKRGVKELYPSVLYSLGWAFYQTGRTAEAAPLFKRFADEFPRSELASRARSLAGLCASAGGQTARLLRRPGQYADGGRVDDFRD